MKKLQVIATFLVIATLSFACSESKKLDSSSSGPSTAAAEKDVRAVSEEYDRAMRQQDAGALERIYAPNAKVIESSGKELTRAEVIAIAKAGDVKYDEGTSEDISVQVHGDAAVVRGTWVQKGTSKGQAFAGKLRYSTFYVKHEGKWLVLSDQVTPIGQ